ncbi:polysaccharide biosynthesis protein GtrA [Lysobacteraceae bacterium NML91-0213]|nr:polysaccharide biosynthesis protein GtrA [Xanthomonadaceae bacterium NML91-0213]
MRTPLFRAARPLRFIMIGLLATLTHLVTAFLLTWAAPQLSVYLANSLAFCVAFMVSFYGHTHFTFGRRGSLTKFLLVSISGFALNNLILHGAQMLGVAPRLALALAIAIVPVFTYVASSIWAFSRRDTPT